MNKRIGVILGLFSLLCVAYAQVNIGLSFSDFATRRWPRERDEMSKALRAAGFEPLVREANHDARLQAKQLREMAQQGISVIIVVAEDGRALAPVVDEIAELGTKVIAFDRLIPARRLAAYVSFDNFEIGRQQSLGILEAMGQGGAKRIVLLAGSPTDRSAHIFRAGQMDVLQPLIASGKLIVVADRWVDNWDPANAVREMRAIMEATRGKFDGVVASNDGTALGALSVLREYNMAGKVPISGQDATEMGCNYIAHGKLTLTILKDTRLLGPEACALAIKLAKGETDLGLPIVPLGEHYKDSSIDVSVPCDFLPLRRITKANLKELVVDSGFQSYEGVFGDVADEPPR
jgi:D-xylose transport system substrate-binding protein